MPTKKRSTDNKKSRSVKKKKSTSTKKSRSVKKKKSSGTKKSHSGQILRKAYTRKSKSGKLVKVPAAYIDKQGRPGVKGPKIIIIAKVGLMKGYGYSLDHNKEERQKAINKAIKDRDKLEIIRHINAIRTLQKSHPKIWKKLDNDVKYIEKKYFPNREGWKKSVAKAYSDKERKTPRTAKEVKKIESALAKKKTSGAKKKTTRKKK
jgi:hypothetical protein